MEILAPAGNFECLKVAIANGANAVYFGVNKFNARNNIQGFSEQDIEEIVNYCHLRNVKAYLAINILFKDEELQSALDLVCYANNLGVDAFIVQDLGLISLIKSSYPNIVLHASTQMAIHNLSGAKILKKLGFSRVVLARETSLDEIKNITQNCDIEIEYFCQGALCVSFSGNCYMSSYLADKSGNRGLCAQYCRHSYKFLENNKEIANGFLLSAKDICMLSYLKELRDAGVISLKIEGRARRPYYVATACRVYSKALKTFKYTDNDINDLSLAFNRDYTSGYFKGNNDIISNYSNHIGIVVGKIKSINKGKKFDQVFVQGKNVSKKSVLKFFDKDKEVNSLSPYDIKKTLDGFMFTTTSKLKTGLTVRLLADNEIETNVNDFNDKLTIKIKVIANKNKKLKLIFNELEKEYEILQEAKTKPFEKQDFENCFNKNKDFNVEIDLETDGVFVLNSYLNNVRKDFLVEIKNNILNNYLKNNKIIKIDNKNKIIYKNKSKIYKFDYKIVQNCNFDKNINKIIIYSPENYCEKEILNFNKFMDGKDWYLDLPNYATQKEVELLKQILNKTNAGVVVNNLYALDFNCKKIGGSFLNVYNSFSVNLLKEFDIEKIFIAEAGENEVLSFYESFEYAYREKVYMTLKFCPIKQIYKVDCANCKWSNGLKYKLNNKEFALKRKKCIDCTFYLTD